MNKKAIGIIGLIALGLFVLPYAMAQNDNEFQVWVTSMGFYKPDPTNRYNVSGGGAAYFISVTGAQTSLYITGIPVTINISQPANIQKSIAQQLQARLKQENANYTVVSVFMSDYVKVIP